MASGFPRRRLSRRARRLPSQAPRRRPPRGRLLRKDRSARQQCEAFNHSAPGDEYFGRLKLSFLGINNTFFDERIRAGEYTTDSNIISHVDQADQALQDWAHKYPDDPQLSRSYFLAARVYKKIYTEPAQRKSLAYMNLLVQKYGNTFFGKTAKSELAKGYTLHWFNQSVPCGAVTPAPLATPTAAPGPRTSRFCSPRASRRSRDRRRKANRTIKENGPGRLRRPFSFRPVLKLELQADTDERTVVRERCRSIHAP